MILLKMLFNEGKKHHIASIKGFMYLITYKTASNVLNVIQVFKVMLFR